MSLFTPDEISAPSFADAACARCTHVSHKNSCFVLCQTSSGTAWSCSSRQVRHLHIQRANAALRKLLVEGLAYVRARRRGPLGDMHLRHRLYRCLRPLRKVQLLIQPQRSRPRHKVRPMPRAIKPVRLEDCRTCPRNRYRPRTQVYKEALICMERRNQRIRRAIHHIRWPALLIQRIQNRAAIPQHTQSFVRPCLAHHLGASAPVAIRHSIEIPSTREQQCANPWRNRRLSSAARNRYEWNVPIEYAATAMRSRSTSCRCAR